MLLVIAVLVLIYAASSTYHHACPKDYFTTEFPSLLVNAAQQPLVLARTFKRPSHELVFIAIPSWLNLVSQFTRMTIKEPKAYSPAKDLCFAFYLILCQKLTARFNAGNYKTLFL